MCPWANANRWQSEAAEMPGKIARIQRVLIMGWGNLLVASGALAYMFVSTCVIWNRTANTLTSESGSECERVSLCIGAVNCIQFEVGERANNWERRSRRRKTTATAPHDAIIIRRCPAHKPSISLCALARDIRLAHYIDWINISLIRRTWRLAAFQRKNDKKNQLILSSDSEPIGFGHSQARKLVAIHTFVLAIIETRFVTYFGGHAFVLFIVSKFCFSPFVVSGCFVDP